MGTSVSASKMFEIINQLKAGAFSKTNAVGKMDGHLPFALKYYGTTGPQMEAKSMITTKKNLWTLRQNKPSYIVRDIIGKLAAHGEISDGDIYEILLKRGIFKWLAVRRQIIKLKNEWRGEITDTLNDLQIVNLALRKWNKSLTPHHLQQLQVNRAYLRGYLKAKTECREQVRTLCHSERWQVQDNDREAERWLEEYEG